MIPNPNVAFRTCITFNNGEIEFAEKAKPKCGEAGLRKQPELISFIGMKRKNVGVVPVIVFHNIWDDFLRQEVNGDQVGFEVTKDNGIVRLYAFVSE